jgi:ketosteroid isomerase-like protein
MGRTDRLEAALRAIDAANAADPTVVTVRNQTGPKEVLHAACVSEWAARLRPDASDALQLAARGHHLRRWTVPRATYPAGRSGYLKWRKALHEQHARELGAILTDCGYDDATIRKVQALVRKEGLAGAAADSDLQALEDALCLVFLETQFADIAARLEPETMARVLVKTADKMSAAGAALIAQVPLGPGLARLLDEALARDTVQRYLDALAAHEWDALAATLDPNVARIGPYHDEFRGREPYAAFLRSTVSRLSGYALAIERVIADGSTVSVELNETVDDDGARLRTDEVVVFDVANRLITRVRVYLQTSERSAAEPAS